MVGLNNRLPPPPPSPPPPISPCRFTLRRLQVNLEAHSPGPVRAGAGRKCHHEPRVAPLVPVRTPGREIRLEQQTPQLVVSRGNVRRAQLQRRSFSRPRRRSLVLFFTTATTGGGGGGGGGGVQDETRRLRQAPRRDAPVP